MHNQDSLLPRPEPPSPTPPWKMNGGTNPYPRSNLDLDPEDDKILRRLTGPRHVTSQLRTGRFKSSFAHWHKIKQNAKVVESIPPREPTPAQHQLEPPTQADLHTSPPVTHHQQGGQSTPFHPPVHAFSPHSSKGLAHDKPDNARPQTPKTPNPNHDGSRGRVKMNPNHSKGGGYTRPQTQEDPEDIPVHASYFRRKRELKTRISKNFNNEEQEAFDHMVQAALSNSLEASCGTVEAFNPKLDEEQDETGYQEGTDDPASSYHSTYFTSRSFNSDGENDASTYASSLADNDDSKASASSYHYPVRKHEPPLPLKPQQVKITQNPNTGKHTPSSNRKEQLDVDFPNHRQIDISELEQCVDSSEFIISLASPPQPGQKYGIIIVTSSEGDEVLGATGDEDAKQGSRDEQWEMVHPVRLGLDCSGYVTHGDEIGDGRGEDVLDMGARKAAYDAFEASRRLWLNFVRRPW